MTTNWHPHTSIAAFALALSAFLLSGCSSGNTPPQTGTSTVSAKPTPTDAATDEDTIVRLSQEKSGVPQPGQRMFSSPEEAAAVFKDAVAAKDRRTLVAIFGNDGQQLVFSGDRVQENNDLDAFARRMGEYLHVDRPTENDAVLRVGRENWPFPIPVVKSNDGWFFDTAAGREELLNRHIGENEFNAIAVCRAFVAAEKEYASRDRTGEGVPQYAQHFMSQPGKKDGLYWEVAPGQDLSPMGPLIAEARSEGYPTSRPADHKPHPYKGYLFHILKAQGPAAPGGAMSYVADGKMTKGFAMVASPNKYGASGIMTFIVAKDGKVSEKNLGENTREAVSAMNEYNPDQTWTEVKD
ncbi:MAG TPA: DUF2950 domain-containing protein [Tepidisphaeraceae bacterium]|nr:DUF2950 domain-containing protein [Tepidisphaeraceae bacterium]